MHGEHEDRYDSGCTAAYVRLTTILLTAGLGGSIEGPFEALSPATTSVTRLWAPADALGNHPTPVLTGFGIYRRMIAYFIQD